ncbi:BBE domain-containing protein [Embleya sp. NBC_00896]|uniref:FAD-binding oxidoreductase n=1 Tax=Embleya sp. NBC_00896 TaxID=2975961 RepID=UPI002F9190FB|nr:BBE domain-containing protein [Embleya sp. NBC_00896]
MSHEVSRRNLLGSVGVVAAGASIAGLGLGDGQAQAAETPPPSAYPHPAEGGAAASGASRVLPDDPRYETLSQGFNQRWTSSPRYIQVITSDADVVTGVDEALRLGLRPTVRSGGHCYEDFVENTGGAILDMSAMKDVRKTKDKYGKAAYGVESGATIWDIYTTLFRRYGVTIPGGSCYSVGAGGHVCGGGYGVLSRRDGLTVDHLVQVDVVTVENGHAVVTRAHRSDPPGSHTSDLFWAHTGGGGGNFGVVLRYYFAESIPAPPPNVWLSSIAWPWAELEKNPDDFTKLVANYGRFFETHSGAEEPLYQNLFSLLKLTHKSNGNVVLSSQWAGEDIGPVEDFLAAVEAGLRTKSTVQMYSVGDHFLPYPDKHRRMPWLQATQTLNGSGPNQRGKYKSAYHRKAFTPTQIAGMWTWLTRDVPDVNLTQTLVQIDSYGCRINAIRPHETAVPQRDSVLKLQYQTYWTDPAEDSAHVDFMRGFYEAVYAETGGVPEITDATHDRTTDGAYVNYPDVDLGIATDPAPQYPTLYYKDNYARLQRTKKTWDPKNLFHHQQSIVPPAQ